MLTPSFVLDYVKARLGLPYTPIEYTDDNILDYIRKTSLRTFSRKMPHKNKVVMNLNDDSIKTEVNNEFRIIDPDGVSIIAIVEVLDDMTGMIFSGYPYYGLLGGTIEDAERYVEQTETAGTVYKYSQYNKYYEFVPPNILRILPNNSFGDSLTVIYERFHTHDFRTILPEFEDLFLDLAYADVAIWIAKTRGAFRTMNTPFGDIELNVDDLKSDAQAIRDKIIEDLSTVNPSIIVDAG